MMPKLTWSSMCFSVNGEPTSLISGEFHYFRVPKKAWRERLILLKESGANTVATYIPWIIHEPKEGSILFDDIPERSLTDFLRLCAELSLMVIVRPGPYAYSELCRDGLPTWLADHYPELMSHGPRGERQETMKDASYLHPLFLQKARRYIGAVDALIKPFLATNGGPIVSVQADNEVGGIYIWRGYMDCNREAMGFGREDGHYACFLREKYGTVDALNERYGRNYSSFAEIEPFKNTPDDKTTEGKRFVCDYRNFVKRTFEIYIQTICRWFGEDGIDVDYCTNAGSPAMIPIMRDMPEQNKKHRFFMGVDHYYALSPSAGISMTPEKAVKYAYSLDMLECLGMPPSVLEMQSGSASCYPPILPENLLGFYMTHVALGMKGSNYYVFTGGPNFEDTGANTEIYDYHAPISATGEVRPLYDAQKKRNLYSHQHKWLLTTPRSYDVQWGFTWEMAQDMTSGSWNRYSRDGLRLRAYMASLQLTVALAGGLLKCREIGGELDVKTPLIVPCDQRMSREKQESLIRFVQKGGKLLLTPVVPELDEDFMPCTLLRDFLGVKATRRVVQGAPVLLPDGKKVFDIKHQYCFEGFGGEVIGRNAETSESVIEYKALGNGAVILMGGAYDYCQYCQMDLLEYCLNALGRKRLVKTDCRELMVTLFENGEKAICFLINSLAGAITTSLTIHVNGKERALQDVTVPAMSVLPIELDL